MGRTTTIELGEFAWRELNEEARRQGVSVEEMASHALLLFLADSHSGRLARRVPRRARAAETGSVRADQGSLGRAR